MKVSSKIAYLERDATQPVGTGCRLIAHICNDEGKWGKGFVLALSKRWKKPERQYRNWFRQTPPPQLGDARFVEVEPDIAVVNIVGQHGLVANRLWILRFATRRLSAA